MTGHVVKIRGHKLAVEAKTPAQLQFIKSVYKGRSDEWLAAAAAEDAMIVERMERRRG